MKITINIYHNNILEIQYPVQPNTTYHSIVNCKWEEYSSWSDCSLTCGEGFKVRYRKTEQKARNGGKDCSGSYEDTTNCETKPCEGNLKS